MTDRHQESTEARHNTHTELLDNHSNAASHALLTEASNAQRQQRPLAQDHAEHTGQLNFGASDIYHGKSRAGNSPESARSALTKTDGGLQEGTIIADQFKKTTNSLIRGGGTGELAKSDVAGKNGADASDAVSREAVATGNALITADPDFPKTGKLNPSAQKVLSDAMDGHTKNLKEFNDTLNRELSTGFGFKVHLERTTADDIVGEPQKIKTISVTNNADKEVFRAEEANAPSKAALPDGHAIAADNRSNAIVPPGVELTKKPDGSVAASKASDGGVLRTEAAGKNLSEALKEGTQTIGMRVNPDPRVRGLLSPEKQALAGSKAEKPIETISEDLNKKASENTVNGRDMRRQLDGKPVTENELDGMNDLLKKGIMEEPAPIPGFDDIKNQFQLAEEVGNFRAETNPSLLRHR